MRTIVNNFPITSCEYNQLDKEFGKLAHYAAWQLKTKNARNNCADDQDDIVQELRIALIQAGSYYKRQTYIESCFQTLERHLIDPFLNQMLESLKWLWANKTRHGAGRQKFGPLQEDMLNRLVKQYVPDSIRPKRDKPLVIDTKFVTYCKQITWNRQKLMGKKITREKVIRSGMVSLSDFDYLAEAGF